MFRVTLRVMSAKYRMLVSKISCDTSSSEIVSHRYIALCRMTQCKISSNIGRNIAKQEKYHVVKGEISHDT